MGKEMNVVIVGAGLAGLTLAERLSSVDGIKITIVEREERVGGLAKSYKYNNGSIFDIGPHRFHTEDEEVLQYINDILSDNKIIIDRNSQLYLFDKYLPWPMSFRNIFSLPISLIFRSGVESLFSKKAKTDSFEDYIIEKYGKTLFNIFFKPYTEKFLDFSCSHLHKDWASTGINRATIDNRIDSSSLVGLAKSIIFDKNPAIKFIYPKDGGIGAFAEELLQRVKKCSGEVLLATRVKELITEGGKIIGLKTDKDREIRADYVFWSGELDSLTKLGFAPANIPKLPYLSSIFFNYLLNTQITQKFQWCYYGEKKMEADRVCVPRNFNPACVPPGKEALCIEMSCSEYSESWQDPARLDCIIESFLLRTRLIKSTDDIIDYHIEKVPQTYPIYTINYHRKLTSFFSWVSATWDNLVLLGRTGRFWYNNMDHSIKASLNTAQKFTADFKAEKLQTGEAYAIEDRYFDTKNENTK